ANENRGFWATQMHAYVMPLQNKLHLADPLNTLSWGVHFCCSICPIEPFLPLTPLYSSDKYFPSSYHVLDITLMLEPCP
ncbi:hypothetical protein ACQP3D_30815, partial [Escherichia coli]